MLVKSAHTNPTHHRSASVLSRSRRLSKGFSLVEILLALGAVAAVAVSAFIVYPYVRAANHAKVEQENMVELVGGIDRVIRAPRTYADVNLRMLQAARLVPERMNYGEDRINGSSRLDNSMISSWGQYVNVGSMGPQYLFVFYAAMPTNVCAKLLPIMDKRVKGYNVDDVWIKHPSLPKPTLRQFASACKSQGRFTSQERPGLDVYFLF